MPLALVANALRLGLMLGLGPEPPAPPPDTESPTPQAPTLPPAPAPNTDPPREAIRWDAPTGCPDGDAVEQRIRALLGRPIEAGEVQLDGRVSLATTGYALELDVVVGTTRETRTLSADACDALADAAALVAVIVLDPVAAATTIETTTAPVSEPPLQQPQPPPQKDVRPPPKQRERKPRPTKTTDRPPQKRRLGFNLRIAGGGEFGAVPGGTGGFSLGPALVLPRLRAELLGSYFIGRGASIDDGSVRVHLGTVTARACYRITPGAIEIPFCGGLELGAMRGDGSDAPASRSRHGLWLAANVGTAIAWYFSQRFGLWVGLQGFAPIVFPRFELESPADAEETRTVYRPSPLGVRGLLGLEVRLRDTVAR